MEKQEVDKIFDNNPHYQNMVKRLMEKEINDGPNSDYEMANSMAMLAQEAMTKYPTTLAKLDDVALRLKFPANIEGSKEFNEANKQ